MPVVAVHRPLVRMVVPDRKHKVADHRGAVGHRLVDHKVVADRKLVLGHKALVDHILAEDMRLVVVRAA